MWNNHTNRQGYGKKSVPPKPSVASAKSVDYATFDFVRTSKPRKILTYTGSKDRLLPYLIWLANDAAKLNNLTHYKEFYGGSGSLLLNHSFLFDTYWYNDVDEGMCSLMIALGDMRYVHSVIDKLKMLGVSRNVFDQAKVALDSKESLSLVDLACNTYISIMQSYGAGREAFNPMFIRKPKEVERYYKQVQTLDSFLPFLSQVKITNEDTLKLLKDTLHDGSSLFFLDPPYHPNSGMSGNNHYGKNSMSAEQHQELVGLLLRTNSKVILSGYDNDDYQRLITYGWRKLFLGSLRTIGSKKGGEYVWINFEISSYLEESFAQAEKMREAEREKQEELD